MLCLGRGAIVGPRHLPGGAAPCRKGASLLKDRDSISGVHVGVFGVVRVVYGVTVQDHIRLYVYSHCHSVFYTVQTAASTKARTKRVESVRVWLVHASKGIRVASH